MIRSVLCNSHNCLHKIIKQHYHRAKRTFECTKYFCHILSKTPCVFQKYLKTTATNTTAKMKQGFMTDNSNSSLSFLRLFRYLSYRQFVRWVWHRLGKHRREILPACVVMSIRHKFPSDEYTGFKYPKIQY